MFIKELEMGMVQTEILLKNLRDQMDFELGHIKEQDVKTVTVTAVVDSGAMGMVITESLRQQLGLGIKGERQVTFANNTKEIAKIADPVEIWWKNRDAICSPIVVSGEGRILLGAVPLELMDLIVDPVRQELIGAHGDQIEYLLL
jgi:hypothetical protein